MTGSSRAEGRTLILHGGMHKTGSSAIQDYLYQRLDDPTVEYFSVGRANSSLIVREAFHTRLGCEPTYRDRDFSEEQLQKKQHLALEQFRRRLGETSKSTVIISAESVSLLDHQACTNLASELGEHFDSIKVVLYIRPLHSRVESAFQEKLKNRFVPLEHKIVVNFKRHIGIYDSVFGRENVIIRPYQRSLFPGGNVINDFLQVVGLPAMAPESARSNLGLSLPGVQLLYIYRSYFPQAGAGDRSLVARLADLPGERFRLHPTLLRKILVEREGGGYEWLRERANIDLYDEAPREGVQVKSEQELLQVSTSTIAWLRNQTGGLAMASKEPGPEEIARALRAWAEIMHDSGE